MKPHVFNFTIAYADTDAGGIVYHARYIEIAERARMDMFRNIKDPDGGFVIRKLAIKYMKPLRLGDSFQVETLFAGHGAATMDIEQKFVKDGETYAVMTGTAAYVDKNIRPARIPEIWLKIGE
ncbi:MAG: thioesterase family protein [Rickettsiales bacterium]|jgi:acyl-CoA thioester hydrolase|nr:thioesterase family protein [Rickettsiales bacterium]